MVKGFFTNLYNKTVGFGSKINHGFNTIKQHSKRILPNARKLGLLVSGIGAIGGLPNVAAAGAALATSATSAEGYGWAMKFKVLLKPWMNSYSLFQLINKNSLPLRKIMRIKG